MHEAFYRHLVVVTYVLNNVGAKFDANRAKIASAVSNSFFYMEETNDAMMMTSHVLCESLFVISATIGAKCGEIPRFPNYFFGKITN